MLDFLDEREPRVLIERAQRFRLTGLGAVRDFGVFMCRLIVRERVTFLRRRRPLAVVFARGPGAGYGDRTPVRRG